MSILPVYHYLLIYIENMILIKPKFTQLAKNHVKIANDPNMFTFLNNVAFQS